MLKQFLLCCVGMGVSVCAQQTDYTTPGAKPVKLSGAHLTYYKGPIVSQVQLVSVLWGPRVNTQIKSMLPTFLGALVTSSWIDWQCEYSTKGQAGGTNQVLGRGHFVMQKMITPHIMSTSLTDADIQAELVQQLRAGVLPAPQYDAQGYPLTVYMIEFPPGVAIDLGGSSSCQAGGFCAYHSTMSYNGRYILYSVHPDYSEGSGCAVGCGAGTMLQNQQAVHSHELAETLTDPFVGVAPSLAYPLAWYDENNGEVGDICNGEQVQMNIGGKAYMVQKEWSNRQGACIATNPHLAAAPHVATAHTQVKAGSSVVLKATGGAAPYQWYHNGVLVANATGATLTLKKVTKQQAGSYVARGACTQASSAITLAVK